MTLFKYRQNADILASRKLPFRPPKEFNDPFEFGAKVDYSEVTRDAFKAYYLKTDLMFMKWCGESRSAVSVESRKSFESNIDEISNTAYDEFMGRNSTDRTCEYFSEMWAVACFSEAQDNILMWSHYANGHKGIVIEFNIEILQIAKFLDLQQVCYGTEKPKVTFLLGERSFSDVFPRIASHKHNDWDYEKEWRIIAHRICLEDKQFYLFDPNAVVSVTFGCRCETPIKDEVCQLLKHPDYSHVRLFQAKPSNTDYKLDIQESPRS